MKAIHKEHFTGDLQELTIQDEERNIALDIYTARGSKFYSQISRGEEQKSCMCIYVRV